MCGHLNRLWPAPSREPRPVCAPDSLGDKQPIGMSLVTAGQGRSNWRRAIKVISRVGCYAGASAETCAHAATCALGTRVTPSQQESRDRGSENRLSKRRTHAHTHTTARRLPGAQNQRRPAPADVSFASSRREIQADTISGSTITPATATSTRQSAN